MKFQKKKLVTISRKVSQKKPLSPQEIEYILAFEKKDDDSKPLAFLKKIALPLALIFGFFFVVYPEQFDELAHSLPSWTNLSPNLLAGVDYLWNLIGEPIGQANILYHLPNIILYSFGILGIKKIIDSIDRKTWLDKVFAAQEILRSNLLSGNMILKMKTGHSLLFIGNGDFIGMQFALNHPDTSVTISRVKPSYSDTWNYYDIETLYDDLKQVIERAAGESAGEYMFFPVKDDQIFLPGPSAYDLSPHKLDILCQNIRTIEKEKKWRTKRIIIIGDKFHKSFVQSEDQRKVIKKSEDVITLHSIAQKYPKVTLLDPTDVVLERIIELAGGRKIVFRATKEGIAEYKKRFYERLTLLGYRHLKSKKGILTIGYDLFEDQTEQQTLSRKIDDYYPVVLSKSVRDALIRNGYKKSEFLYVPDLVLKTLARAAAEQ